MPSNHKICHDVELYVTLNGFTKVAGSSSFEALYYRGNEALVFSNGTICYKQNPSSTFSHHRIAILVEWSTIKRYQGFDGQNIFFLMLLLHIMGAIKIQDVNRASQKLLHESMVPMMMDICNISPVTA